MPLLGFPCAPSVAKELVWNKRASLPTTRGSIRKARVASGRFTTQHMLFIKFKLGITRGQVVEEIRSEPNVANVFSELIRDSYIAEMDGHIALVMIVEGESDSDVAENVQGKIIPSLQKNHGEDSIQELSSIRLLDPIRCFHNYLPMVNIDEGFINKDWPDEAIFVE
ncbi:MAG: hypothetical protein ACI8P2_003571 [Candidatus Latescibacterota bacterium]